MQLIGTDIIEIARIKRVMGRWGTRFLHRVYTTLKALGTQTSGISWKDIEILSDPTGKPMVNLHGQAQLQTDYLQLENLAISLSHSREYALAVVIGETRQG